MGGGNSPRKCSSFAPPKYAFVQQQIGLGSSESPHVLQTFALAGIAALCKAVCCILCQVKIYAENITQGPLFRDYQINKIYRFLLLATALSSRDLFHVKKVLLQRKTVP